MEPRELGRRVTTFLALLFVVLAGPTVFAQATESITGAAPTVPHNEWGGALIWAFFSSSVLEWLKRHPQLTLISETTTFHAQRALGIVLATAAALGVHWSFDAANGVLTVTGLRVAAMWTFGGEVIRQWVMQELTYRVAIKHYRPGGQ